MKSIFAMFVLTFAFTGYAFGECSNADKTALEAFDRAWAMALENGDKAGLMSVYADDYVGFPGMQNKTGAIEGTMKAFERNKANPAGADKATHDSYAIACSPNTATITHRNIIWTPNGTGGKPETIWTRSIHFLEKRGGNWQVVSNAGHAMDDAMTLGYMEHDWNDAAVKKDKGWFDKNYAADYTSVSSKDGSLTNKEQDIADTMKATGGDDWNQLSGLNIRIDGNTAIVTGVNHVKGKDDKGVAYDLNVRFTDTWIKRDGHWLAWATQGTRIP